MKRIAGYKSPIIALLCFVGMSTNIFAWQYWLNPAGTIVGFPLILILLYFTFSPLFRLLWKKYRNRKTIGVLCATLLAWVIGIALLNLMPNGVAVRLGQFSEQEFHEAAGVIDAACAKHRDESGFTSGFERSQSFQKELKEGHAIFNLSTFPMNVSKGEDGEDYTTVGWYGGLVGGYDVVIFEKGDPPKWLRNYRAIFLYDTVAYYEIEDYADGG